MSNAWKPNWPTSDRPGPPPPARPTCSKSGRPPREPAASKRLLVCPKLHRNNKFGIEPAHGTPPVAVHRLIFGNLSGVVARFPQQGLSMRKILIVAGLLMGGTLLTGTPAKADLGCLCVKLGAPSMCTATVIACNFQVWRRLRFAVHLDRGENGLRSTRAKNTCAKRRKSKLASSSFLKGSVSRRSLCFGGASLR